MLPQLRPLALPTSDPAVRVVALGEHPRVAARNIGELEHEPPRVALPGEHGIAHVPLVGDPVDDAAAEPRRLRGDPVGTVGADDHPGAEALSPQEHDRGLRLDAHAHTLAYLNSLLARGVEQERI